jgi:serine/threonine-protein kinase HipA
MVCRGQGRAARQLSELVDALTQYDIRPVPTDHKATVVATNINLDKDRCSLDLLGAASEYFALTLAKACIVIKEVATVTTHGAILPRQLVRAGRRSIMTSAFEHNDLRRALTL